MVMNKASELASSGIGLALYEVKVVQNHLKGGKKMKTLKTKKILSLVLILLLAIGWFHVNVCEAQEEEQPISEGTARQDIRGEIPPPESQAQNPKSNILEDYVIPIALIPAIPIFAGLQFGCILFYGIFGKEGRNPCVPK
jgi:hypothetical protein